MKDQDLRDRFAAWARPIESAQVPAIEIISRRARRRRRRIAVAGATAAATGCLALVVVLPIVSQRHSHPLATTTGWLPAGPLPGPGAGPATAPFFVMLDLQRDPTPAVVYRVSHGHPQPQRIATVRPPRGVTLSDVTAAADDRTFLLTGNRFRGHTMVTRYYELKLNAAGRPGRLIPLRISLPARPEGGLGVAGLSPDGRSLAVVGQSGSGLTVGVVSLGTGAIRTWSAPGPAIQGLNLSWEDARRLALLWTPQHGMPEIRVLDTSLRGGSLMTRSRLLVPATVRFGRFTGLLPAAITSTGREIFALMPLHPPYGPGALTAVVEFSARTGRPDRVIAQSQESGMGSFCGVLWADRSGRQVVTSCGYRLGSSRGGHFTLWSGRSFWYSLKYVPFAW